MPFPFHLLYNIFMCPTKLQKRKIKVWKHHMVDIGRCSFAAMEKSMGAMRGADEVRSDRQSGEKAGGDRWSRGARGRPWLEAWREENFHSLLTEHPEFWDILQSLQSDFTTYTTETTGLSLENWSSTCRSCDGEPCTRVAELLIKHRWSSRSHGPDVKCHEQNGSKVKQAWRVAPDSPFSHF